MDLEINTTFLNKVSEAYGKGKNRVPNIEYIRQKVTQIAHPDREENQVVNAKISEKEESER